MASPRSRASQMTATQSPGGLEATRHGNHVASSPELTPNSVSTGPVQRGHRNPHSRNLVVQCVRVSRCGCLTGAVCCEVHRGTQDAGQG